MVTFTSVPKHMDKAMYMKSLSKEYHAPLDMIYYLSKDLNDEKAFFVALEWNKINNWMNKKK